MSQYFYEVSEREKFPALRHLCENTDLGRSLIFRRTKHGVDRLTQQLKARKADLIADGDSFYSAGKYAMAIERWRIVVEQGLTEGAEKTTLEAKIRNTQNELKKRVQDLFEKAVSAEASMTWPESSRPPGARMRTTAL